MSKTISKTDFLFKAIDEVQQTNRFLDAKAGLLSGFESALLVILISNFLDNARLQLIFELYNGQKWYFLILLVGYILLYVISLVSHILFTLRIILPFENPESHVNPGNFKSRNLFFIHKLDKNKKIIPSLSTYRDEMSKMGPEDMMSELILEFLKLSYIRKTKSDHLRSSLRSLYILIVGMVILGLLFIAGNFLLH